MRLASALAALLAGCATTPPELYEARDSWQGAAYGEVVARWGARPGAQSSRRARFLHLGFESAVAAALAAGAWAPGVRRSRRQSVRCERTLAFSNGRSDQGWRGAIEYARSSGAAVSRLTGGILMTAA
jgi:hypothetical protein